MEQAITVIIILVFLSCCIIHMLHKSKFVEGINFPMGRAHWKLGYNWQTPNVPIPRCQKPYLIGYDINYTFDKSMIAT